MALLIFGSDSTQTLLHLRADTKADPTLRVEGDAGKHSQSLKASLGHSTNQKEGER